MRRLLFLIILFPALAFAQSAPLPVTTQAMADDTTNCIYSATDPAGQYRINLTSGAVFRCASTGKLQLWQTPACPANPTTVTCTAQAMCKDSTGLFICSASTFKFVVVSGGGGGSLVSLSDVQAAAGLQNNTLVRNSSGIWVAQALPLNSSNAVQGVLANTNTTANTQNVASSIVARDPSGNFSAGVITGALNGNALSATSALNANQCTLSDTGDSATNFFTQPGFLPVSQGGTGASPAFDDQVWISSGAGAGSYKTLPICAGGAPIHYETTTNAWTCATGGNGNVIAATSPPPGAQQLAIWDAPTNQIKGQTTNTVDTAGNQRSTSYTSPPDATGGGTMCLFQDLDLNATCNPVTLANCRTWCIDIGQWAAGSSFSCGVDPTTGKILSSCIQGANALALTKGQIFTHSSTVDFAHAIGTDGQILGYLASNADGLANYDAMNVTITSEARGDTLYRGASGWLNKAAGTSGFIWTTQGAGADPIWAAAPVATTLTTKGDLQGHNGSINVRVPVGTDGQLLKADSAAGAGVSYVTPAVMTCGTVGVNLPSTARQATGVRAETVTGLSTADICVCQPIGTDFDDDVIIKGCWGTTNTINVRFYVANGASADPLDPASQTMTYCCYH